MLFNLAALYLQRGDLSRARKYADQVNPQGQTDDFRRKLRLLKDETDRLELLTASPSQVVDVLVSSPRCHSRAASEKGRFAAGTQSVIRKNATRKG